MIINFNMKFVVTLDKFLNIFGHLFNQNQDLFFKSLIEFLILKVKCVQ